MRAHTQYPSKTSLMFSLAHIYPVCSTPTGFRPSNPGVPVYKVRSLRPLDFSHDALDAVPAALLIFQSHKTLSSPRDRLLMLLSSWDVPNACPAQREGLRGEVVAKEWDECQFALQSCDAGMLVERGMCSHGGRGCIAFYTLRARRLCTLMADGRMSVAKDFALGWGGRDGSGVFCA